MTTALGPAEGGQVPGGAARFRTLAAKPTLVRNFNHNPPAPYTAEVPA